MRLGLVILLLFFAAAAQADISYKSYFDYQDVNLGTTQRLRLMSALKLGDSISTDIAYELRAQSNRDFSASFDRLNLKWNNWTIGRDAVSFGVGRIWSPNDLFEPFAPTEIDKDYKTGIDLLRYDRSINDLSDITLLYTPLNSTPGSYVGRLRGTIGSFGASLITGRLKDNLTYGFTFDGPMGGAGLRGSVNCLVSPEGNTAYKFILGSDYMFPNDLYTVSEYYYNQGRHYLALGYSLDFRSLWNTKGYIISNLDDGSRLYWEELNYSLSDENSLKAGVILSSGRSNTEYASFSPLVYAQLSAYF